MTIGERIKERRKELGISVDALAQRLKKNRATVYRYESGDIESLPHDILKPLAEALQTSPEYLMELEGIQEKNDAISDIIITMRTDDDFFALVETLHKANAQQRAGLKQMLPTMQTDDDFFYLVETLHKADAQQRAGMKQMLLAFFK